MIPFTLMSTTFWVLMMLSHISIVHMEPMGHKEQLYLAGLYPGSNVDRHVGQDILPAVAMALRDVNKHPDILPGHQLNIIWNDTKCDMAVGTKLFFDLMHMEPAKVMLFGGACPHVTAPIAESTKWWNIWQVSYGDTNPVLSDRVTYPYFFRTIPSDSEHNPARIRLLNYFNWTRVGTLYQDASLGSHRYAYSHNKLIDLLENEGGFETISESFSLDPNTALLNLKNKDARVIIVNFDERVARKVFCSAIQHEMVGPRYVWILMGDYSDTWWDVPKSEHLPCTASLMRHHLAGYFTTDIQPLSATDDVTIADKTSSQYFREYRSKVRTTDRYHGYAYDGIWVIAQAIDHVIKQNNGVLNMADLRQDTIHQALNDTNFIGVTGRVRFNNGDRVGLIAMKQFVNDELRVIGEYDAQYDTLNIHNDVYWKDNKLPRDRSLREPHLRTVNRTIVIILVMLASCGIVLATCFLLVNIKFRNHSYVKMSSPNMNNVIIIGCIITYVEVLLLGANSDVVRPENYPILCVTRTWFLCIGFTLSFGAIFCKTWRVHAIFTNATLARKVIPDSQLLLMVTVFLFVDIALLTSWQILDPTSRQTVYLPIEIDASGSDIEIIPVVESCVSSYKNIWIGCIYVYKGLLLLFGCFLAWETRQVTIAALNDSKYIGMSVYNTVILCVSGAAVSMLLEDELDAAYLIICLFIIFCTTITLCLVCVPKIVELKRDPKGKKRPIRAKLPPKPAVFNNDHASPTYNQKIRQLMDDNYKYRCILEQKNREIAELEAILDENCNEMSEETVATPGDKYSTDEMEVDNWDMSDIQEHSNDHYQLRCRANNLEHANGNSEMLSQPNCALGYNATINKDSTICDDIENIRSTFLHNRIQPIQVGDILTSSYFKETDIISDEDANLNDTDKVEDDSREPDVTTSLLA